MIGTRKIWSRLRGLLLCVITSAPLSADTYYVSYLDGDNLNRGTFSEPWKTIQKAANTMVAGDTCYIRAGIYRETVTPSNSGSVGSYITYKAYAGEKVVISGCEEIVGNWNAVSGSIYKVGATLDLMDKNQVFVNGSQMMWEARWPDVGTASMSGLLEFATATMEAGTDSTNIIDSSIPDYDWTDGSVWVSSKNRWYCWTGQITGFSSGTVSLIDNSDAGGNHVCQQGGSYFLFGVRDALDSPNEWYYDSSLNELYLWMPDSSVPSAVEVKARLYGFNLRNRQFIRLEDLEFFATSIETNATSDSLIFDNLRMDYVYHSNKAENNYGSQRRTGLVLSGNNHELTNSIIAYSSGSGVFLEGSDHWMVNNYLHDHDYIGGYASALELVASDCIISHNTMTRTGRQVLGLRDSFGSIIQNNDFSYAGYLTTDLGLVYGNGIDGENLVVRYNWFHDNVSSFKGFGIYYDHGCRDIITHNNLIWNVPDSGIHNNQYANYLLWYNNTTINGGATSILSKWANNQAKDLHGCQFINNILSGATDIIAVDYLLKNNFENYTDLDVNFVPTAGSSAIDAGLPLASIWSALGYVGLGLDAGAIESGTTPWTAGHDFGNFPDVSTKVSLPRARNRLKNSSFERATLLPWIVMAAGVSLNNEGNGSQSIVDGTTLMGNYSAALEGGQTGIMQTIDGLEPDTLYELMGKFRVDTNESAYLGVKDYGDVELLGSIVTDTSNLWVKETLLFRTGPASTSAIVYAWKNSLGAGTVYFEDAGLQVVETNLIKNDFEVNFSDWTVVDTVSLDQSGQSAFDDNGTDSQGVRLVDDDTTTTQMDRSISVDVDEPVYIQFDYSYSAGVQVAGFQLWGGGIRGLNMHMTGFGVNDDAIQNNPGSGMVTLANGLFPDVWYRFTLTLSPASTVADVYDLSVRSLDYGSSYTADFTGLSFQSDLTVFDTIRFHFNTSQINIGGEFFIDNLVISNDISDLWIDLDQDGIEDSWELLYFGDLTAADAVSDANSDGVTDLTAFNFGSDPLVDSTPRRLILDLSESGLNLLSFPSFSGRNYQIQYSTDLTIWHPFFTVFGTGEEIFLGVDPLGQFAQADNRRSLFYRFKPVDLN